jgi:hypothetical protein
MPHASLRLATASGPPGPFRPWGHAVSRSGPSSNASDQPSRAGFHAVEVARPRRPSRTSSTRGAFRGVGSGAARPCRKARGVAVPAALQGGRSDRGPAGRGDDAGCGVLNVSGSVLAGPSRPVDRLRCECVRLRALSHGGSLYKNVNCSVIHQQRGECSLIGLTIRYVSFILNKIKPHGGPR